MTSPNRPWLSHDDSYYHSSLHTRTNTLTSLIRTRSQQSLTSPRPAPPTPRHLVDDEETGSMRNSWMRNEDEDIERLLRDESRLSQILLGPQARSLKLIGRSNPRYRWEQYWKTKEQLNDMKKPICEFYQRTNSLIQQYMYIDCLLDSSIPHELLNEYANELEASAFKPVDIPDTIAEETPQASYQTQSHLNQIAGSYGSINNFASGHNSSSSSTLKTAHEDDEEAGPQPNLPWLEDADLDHDDPIVALAIWINLIANVILLAGKIAVIISVPSMSVLAALVDAVLDLLSTAIVWTTTRLISSSQRDQHNYPVGRSRLEPLGVLVFSVIMVTSFCQVSLECIQRLAGPDHQVLQLGLPAIIIMITTIVIKGGCWLWCRLVKNSSVRALADDAITDVIFNIGSILFPLVGFYGRIWWLDASGGLLLSLVVIIIWSRTSAQHIRNLTGFSAQPDERNLLLYLTMRFATAIRQIQNLRAYHAGDKLFVEVDIVLSANTPLKDSHDLSEVLTYFLESVPIVDRAFVHVDYLSYNAPTHMLKQPAS
ncbi:cation efflux family domain-containing protein [Trichoderma breve]|uniref:Cation efflux family domain-containing protein n=1 Tax=Trichoderma breve TaxID=2034170 RepID=A0A9W9ECS2_9HYPO|nr:cation efflux family domain-containing protein [Trichoderma breve]KAJ4864273.1 cation efflux family domain-containing protein [Trichoderma breve]